MIRYVAALAFLGSTALAETHFHHLHLNSTDPAAAADFYPAKFECEKATYDGKPAVWAQKSWLLFNKVAAPPPTDVITAIWHFGWGAENMKETYQKQLDSGTASRRRLPSCFLTSFSPMSKGPTGRSSS